MHAHTHTFFLFFFFFGSEFWKDVVVAFEVDLAQELRGLGAAMSPEVDLPCCVAWRPALLFSPARFSFLRPGDTSRNVEQGARVYDFGAAEGRGDREPDPRHQHDDDGVPGIGACAN